MFKRPDQDLFPGRGASLAEVSKP